MAVVSVNAQGKLVKAKAKPDDKVVGTPGKDEKKVASQTQSSDEKKAE